MGKIKDNFVVIFENGQKFRADTLVKAFAILNVLKSLTKYKCLTFRIENAKVHDHERSELYDRGNEVSQTF